MAESDNRNYLRNVLMEDQAQVNDFMQVRMRKALGDLKALIEGGSEDLIEWSSCFSYLSHTYGRSSDEAFKWFKYYLREGKIPASIQLPLLMQVQSAGAVDGGFVNILARVMKNEPQEEKERRIRMMKEELASSIDNEGKLCLYRGAFLRPFGKVDDGSRPIEKAYSFTVDESVAVHYASCWYPESARVYTVQVPLEEVARYNIYEEDKPVVILPQSKGGSVKVIQERILSREDYEPAGTEDEAKMAYKANFGN